MHLAFSPASGIKIRFMRKLFMAVLLILSCVSYGQIPVDSLEIRRYVDSINILLDTWTKHDPVLSVETSGMTTILHQDGSRFIFDMSKLTNHEATGPENFHGVRLRPYDPRTRPAEQHFILFTDPAGSDGMIRFGKISREALDQIFDLFVSLRTLFLN